MKKSISAYSNILAGFLLLTTATAFGLKPINDEGNAGETVKAVKGNWGVVLNLSGLINQVKLNTLQDSIGNNSLLFKYYKTDNMVYRIGLGMNIYNRKTTAQDSLKIDQKLLTTDSVYKQSAYSITFGFEKHLGNAKRIDPYIGAQALIGVIGKTKIEVDSKEEGVNGINSTNRDYVLDGGSMFGLQLLSGFNYFPTQNFSIGAEFLFGFTTIKSGGKYSDITVFTPASGSSTSQVDKGELTFRQMDVRPSGSALITLSYFF